jgi:hypothetical protein
MPLRQWQSEHKGFRVFAAQTKSQLPSQGNGQHKQVDQQEIKRKRPGRTPQVLLVDVFNHHDLELPWQQYD